MNVIICYCRSVYKCKLMPLFFCMALCEQRGEKLHKYCLCPSTENSAFECWVLRDNYKQSRDKIWSQVQTGKLVLVVVLMHDTPVTDSLQTHWICIASHIIQAAVGRVYCKRSTAKRHLFVLCRAGIWMSFLLVIAEKSVPQSPGLRWKTTNFLFVILLFS